MTFKWTYIAAGLLTVAAIVVSLPIDGGFWGAVSYIHGIVLVAIGGGLVLFTRTRKQRPHAEGDADVPEAVRADGGVARFQARDRRAAHP